MHHSKETLTSALVALYLFSMFVSCALAADDFSLNINCQQDSMTKQVTLTIFINPPQAVVSYSVDVGENVTLPNDTLATSQGHYVYIVDLPNLTDGVHTVNVYASYSEASKVESQVFTVEANTEPPPSSTPSAPQNQWCRDYLIVIVALIVVTVILIVIIKKEKK
jgi:hypothetical protein